MSFVNDAEWTVLQGLPEEDLIALAVEMDIVVPERIEGRALLDRCVPAMLERGRAEGLPFSKYDVEDLQALPPELLRAIGQVQGLNGDVTVAAVLKAGKAVYKRYRRTGRGSAMALMVPLLLPTLARAAARQ